VKRSISAPSLMLDCDRAGAEDVQTLSSKLCKLEAKVEQMSSDKGRERTVLRRMESSVSQAECAEKPQPLSQRERGGDVGSSGGLWVRGGWQLSLAISPVTHRRILTARVCGSEFPVCACGRPAAGGAGPGAGVVGAAGVAGGPPHRGGEEQHRRAREDHRHPRQQGPQDMRAQHLAMQAQACVAWQHHARNGPFRCRGIRVADPCGGAVELTWKRLPAKQKCRERKSKGQPHRSHRSRETPKEATPKPVRPPATSHPAAQLVPA
jgi:hypothetical protein